ncbi:glycosyltransferase 87 family protein [Caulobacter sp. KR2-114]|uniref:glycosyltransferase 87 family protein n=1 Tax=Caulobacter sp. KR2-114 TaxID=3400912 RepID=UPI003C119616
MTLPDDPRDSPLAQAAMLAVGLVLLVVSWRLFLTPHAIATLYERDLPAYQGAIDAFAAGRDPYLPAQVKRAHGLPFIAPPFVWMLYRLAAHGPIRAVFGNLLMVADVIASAAIPVALSRLLLGPGAARIVLGTGFFAAAFLGSGVFTVLVANNGTVLYALIALGLIPAEREGRWLWFHAAVALATAFKPFYAAFWLVPLLADREARSQWRTAALAVAAAAATYAAPLILAPRLMREWLQTLVTQVVGHERLGDNLLGAVTADPRHFPLSPLAAHAAFSAVLLGGSLMLPRLERRQRIAGLLMVAVFLNPRAMRYDLSMAAVPLLALVAGAAARDVRSSGLAQAAVAAALAAVTIVFSHDAPADGYLYAAVAVAALLGAVLAARRRPAPTTPRPA